MVHKLRKAIENTVDCHILEGMIELNEGYFTVDSFEF